MEEPFLSPELYLKYKYLTMSATEVEEAFLQICAVLNGLPILKFVGIILFSHIL